MFELKIANPELTGPSCAVSWCVDEETLKFLSDNQIANPQVVIVVAPEGRHYHESREIRRVVDMKDLMAYVDLRSAGPNKIWGFISWHGKGAKDRYLTKAAGRYSSSVLNSDGDDYCITFSNESIKHSFSQPLSVVVPTGVFASEPAQWEEDWVNHWFRNKPEDQCEFRRRRLFAYTLQIPLMMGNWLVRLFAFLIALLVGARDLSLEYLLHPLTTDLDNAFEVLTEGSIFVRSFPDDVNRIKNPNPLQLLSYMIRKYCFLPFMPLIMLAVGFAIFKHAWFVMSVLGTVFMMVLFAILTITFFISDTHQTVWSWLTNLFQDKEAPLWYLDQNEIDALTCKTDKKPFDFKTLPARKKTIRLRFQDLKSKVCKPFSA